MEPLSKSITARISEAMNEKLVQIAAAYGIPVTTFVRIALWDLLEKMDPADPDFKFFNVIGQLQKREESHSTRELLAGIETSKAALAAWSEK